MEFNIVKIEKVLDEEFPQHCPGATVRTALKEFLVTALMEQEHFNGKRPFGSRGWYRLLEIPISKHFPSVCKVYIDEAGDIEDSDKDEMAYVKLIKAIVANL